MIHDVHLPEDTKWYLWQIVQIQMDVLHCASMLPGGFTQGDLQTALETTIQVPQAQNISQWVFSHKDTREGLLLFSNHNNLDEKSALIAEMQRDVNRLYTGASTETFERHFPIPTRANPLPDYLDGVQNFLIYFYTHLESGFPGFLFTVNKFNYHKFGRDQFFEAFEKDNPEQYVCAICDEHRFMTILRGEHFSDIEHYFPKSIYPHLACHPYNLIPICKQCNTAHLNKDPLSENNHRRLLGEIFLPYRNESILKQGVVKLDWQTRPDRTDTPFLLFQSLIEPSEKLEKKLRAFSEIYDIPGRWQGRIHEIGEQLWRNIRHYVSIEIQNENTLDLIELKSELELLLEYLFEDQGKTPWGYVLVWYLADLIIEDIESRISNDDSTSPIPILETIKDLQNYDYLKMDFKLRTKEVLEKARTIYDNHQVA